MTPRRALLLALLSILGCAAPLTVAEPRDAGTGTSAPGEFGSTGPLDSGFEGDGASLGDPPADAAIGE